jgi:hypothetical protein
VTCNPFFAFELKNHLYLTYPTGWDDLRLIFWKWKAGVLPLYWE